MANTDHPIGASAGEEEEEEEDDYMSMAIVEPTKTKEKETYTQRRIRKQREAELRSRTKSKKELEAEATAAREAALATSILHADSSSKGLQMMAKLGFKPGDRLGPTAGRASARADPVHVQVKEDRGGIGLDAEKKRKFREQVEGETKRVKAEESDYRERVAREREDRRLEGLVAGAMRVAERMDAEEEAEAEAEEGPPRRRRTANVLWRGLVREREAQERARRMRYDLEQSLTRNANYDDAEEDPQDRLALGGVEEELEEEADAELDAFAALDPAQRLHRLVAFLRQRFHYCFWCKHRYADASLDGCPGAAEEDHD